jgi:hypothetical protein
MADDTRKSELQKATMKEKTGLNKSDYEQNIETRDSDVQMIEDGRKPQLPLSVMDSKGLCFYFQKHIIALLVFSG